MSPSHKEALATGRVEGRAVRRYLESLADNQPRRRRRVATEDLELRLSQVERRLPSANPLARLHLAQERINLRATLADAATEAAEGTTAVEDAFVAVARRYSERKGITWSAWRRAGVPAGVLRRAGLRRTRS